MRKFITTSVLATSAFVGIQSASAQTSQQKPSASSEVIAVDEDFSIAPRTERPVGSDDHPMPQPSSNGPVLSVQAGVESKALFTDQAFTATTRPTAVTDINISADGWMLDIWQRHPLTSYKCDRETDYGLFKTLKVGGGIEAEAKIAYIAVCGRDAVTTRLRLKRDLGKGFSVQIGGERIRGGFVDNVFRSQIAYHRDLSKQWTLDANVTAAHSTFGKGLTLAGSATIGRTFASGWTIEGYGTAYTGHLGHDLAFGIDLRRSFKLGR